MGPHHHDVSPSNLQEYAYNEKRVKLDEDMKKIYINNAFLPRHKQTQVINDGRGIDLDWRELVTSESFKRPDQIKQVIRQAGVLTTGPSDIIIEDSDEMEEACVIATAMKIIGNDRVAIHRRSKAREEELKIEIIGGENVEGERCPMGAQAKVHFTGKFLDGKVFDSSVKRNRPFEF